MSGKKDREPEQAQVQFVGKVFRRRVNPDDPNLLQERRVRIIGGIREESGTIFFRAADESPIDPSELPHIPLDQANPMHDFAETDRSLSTARKGGASQQGTDVEEEYRRRGGKGVRAPIGGGFFSEQERREILKLRKQKGNRVQR